MSPDTKVLRSQSASEPSPLTPQQFFHDLKSSILAHKGTGLLYFKDIDPETGHLVAASLDHPDIETQCVRVNFNSLSRELTVTMPTQFHDVHVCWMKNELIQATLSGFLTMNENFKLQFSVGTSK